jgi:uncharacterized protein YjbJ (UPF0337 family)
MGWNLTPEEGQLLKNLRKSPKSGDSPYINDPAACGTLPLKHGKLIMKQNIKDRVKGSVKEAKGKAKQTAGRALKNPELENKGRAEKWVGKAQRKVGQVEKAFET